MSVLIKEELAIGVYMYHNNGKKLTDENLGHILWDVETMGTLEDYEVADDFEHVYVFMEL